MFSLFFEKKLKYRVLAVRDLTADVIELTLAPQEKNLKYQAGQYIFLSFLDAKIGPEEHPFSLASAPADANLRLVIKTIGDYVKNLKNLSIGSLAMVRGPKGRFSFLNLKNKNQIWIAGGVGVAPFLSMSKILHKHPDYHITLIYCANTEADLVLLDELKTTATACGNFRVASFCSNKQGFITADGIKQIAGGIKDKGILFSGPQPMLLALRDQFAGMGMSAANFHTDDM